MPYYYYLKMGFLVCCCCRCCCCCCCCCRRRRRRRRRRCEARDCAENDTKRRLYVVFSVVICFSERRADDWEHAAVPPSLLPAGNVPCLSLPVRDTIEFGGSFLLRTVIIVQLYFGGTFRAYRSKSPCQVLLSFLGSMCRGNSVLHRRIFGQGCSNLPPIIQLNATLLRTPTVPT